jgi:hypothetical protein
MSPSKLKSWNADADALCSLEFIDRKDRRSLVLAGFRNGDVRIFTLSGFYAGTCGFKKTWKEKE